MTKWNQSYLEFNTESKNNWVLVSEKVGKHRKLNTSVWRDRNPLYIAFIEKFNNHHDRLEQNGSTHADTNRIQIYVFRYTTTDKKIFTYCTQRRRSYDFNNALTQQFSFIPKRLGSIIYLGHNQIYIAFTFTNK